MNKKHGMCGTPTWHSWNSMLRRCRDPKRSNYQFYGGRGITVCDRWSTFDSFLADMGTRPSDTTLDRINTDGNYEPGNCRWSTRSEQSKNKRKYHHKQTKCPAGHPYEGTRSNGHRRCLICHRNREAARRQQRRSQEAA